MNPLFHDLLYPCVTGCLDLTNKSALKIFIRSNIRQTCFWINQKVDKLCKEAFLNIYSELKDVSKDFIYRWILGKPAIHKLENCPKHKVSLELMLEKITNLTPIHYYPAHLLAFIEPEFSVINLATDRAVLEFTKNIQPIFYNDQQLIVFNNMGKKELHRYPSKIIHVLPTLNSMQRLDDHIVFGCMDKVASISIEDLISFDRFHVHEELEGAEFLKAFSGELLFYNPRVPAFYVLYAEDKKLKVNECLMKGTVPGELFLTHHVFHEQSKHTIFLFQQKFGAIWIGAISPDELTPSEPQTFIFHEALKSLQGTLVSFKDTVLFCDIGKTLQIETIDIVDGAILMKPLTIQGVENLEIRIITCAICHLDKLFIIGDSNDGYNWTDNLHHLIIIDMTNLVVESTKELGSYYSRFIPSTLGKLHLTAPNDKTLEIFTIDYT